MLGKALPQIAGRNHLATASAISFYLEEIANGNWPSIKGLSAEEEQLLRDAFTRHALNDAVNRHENLRNAEYLEFSAGKSLNDAGHTLGRFALRQERLTHLPGVGMFVIRDISIGVGQSEVEAKVARGAYEKERRHWLQKNPSVKRYLMRVFYRWRKASTEIILRAKQRPSKKPLARKRMQRRLK
jgi:hypothetical protein